MSRRYFVRQHRARLLSDTCIDLVVDAVETYLSRLLAGEENLVSMGDRQVSVDGDHRDELPDYEYHPSRQKNILTKRIHHREAVQDPATDGYVDAIADELRTLAATWHPIFVEADTD